MLSCFFDHPDLKSRCVSNAHVELTMRVLFSQGGLSLENSQSGYSWRVSELGKVISLINALLLDYHHSRRIVDSGG